VFKVTNWSTKVAEAKLKAKIRRTVKVVRT